jgi:hypothetical protein
MLFPQAVPELSDRPGHPPQPRRVGDAHAQSPGPTLRPQRSVPATPGGPVLLRMGKPSP